MWIDLKPFGRVGRFQLCNIVGFEPTGEKVTLIRTAGGYDFSLEVSYEQFRRAVADIETPPKSKVAATTRPQLSGART